MSEQFTEEEVRILKKICENPIFKQLKPLHVQKRISLYSLLVDICNHYDIDEQQFYSKRREKFIVKARQEFVHHAYKIRKRSVTEIAKTMKKDYSTVSWYLKKPSPETDKLLKTLSESGE